MRTFGRNVLPLTDLAAEPPSGSVGRRRRGPRAECSTRRAGDRRCRACARGRQRAQLSHGIGAGGRQRDARARRDLAGAAFEARGAWRGARRSHQHLVEQRHHDLRIAVAQRIGLQVDGLHVGAVEPRNPQACTLEIFRLLADHEDRVEARDRLELDHILAHAAFGGIHDLVEFRDQRLGRGIAHGEDADRLSLHPVGVEAQDGVDRSLAIGAGTGDDQRVVAVVGTHCGGLDAEAVKQLEHVLRRHVAERHHADALAGFRRAAAVDTTRAGFRGREQPIAAAAVADQRDAGHFQRILQHIKRVRLRHRTHRGQRHGSLHARIDHIADLEHVTEDDLGNGRHRRILEVEIVTTASAVTLGECRACRRCAVGEIDRRSRRALLPDAASAGVGDLARLDVEVVDFFGDVLRARIPGIAFHRLIGGDDARGQRECGQKQNQRSSQP